MKGRGELMSYQVDLVLDAKATLGEGPHWEEREQLLYWVDIIEKRLHVYNHITSDTHFYQFNHYIGAAVPGQLGNFIVALQNGIYTFDLESEELSLITDPEVNLPSNRFNDGKCDSKGRFYVGTMDVDAKPGCGAFYRLDRNGEIKKLLSNVSISNGLAFSPDEAFLYHIDTSTGEMSIYNYDEQSGDISFKEVGITIPKEMGSPDGMTIDREGMVWIAHWGGGCVTRWNPHTGKQLDEIIVPAKNVTSCTFGGEHLDELYITTARIGLTDEELALYPLSGGVFKVKLGISGYPGYSYR